jgi:hypothetical protein
MPNTRQQESNSDLRQKELDAMWLNLAKAKHEANVFIGLIEGYQPIDAMNFNSLLQKSRDNLKWFDVLDNRLKSQMESGQLSCEEQADMIDYRSGLWDGLLVNIGDLWVKSPLNRYTDELPGDSRKLKGKLITDHDLKVSAMGALTRISMNVNEAMRRMHTFRSQDSSQMAVVDDHKHDDFPFSEDIDNIWKSFDQFAKTALQKQSSEVARRGQEQKDIEAFAAGVDNIASIGKKIRATAGQEESIQRLYLLSDLVAEADALSQAFDIFIKRVDDMSNKDIEGLCKANNSIAKTKEWLVGELAKHKPQMLETSRSIERLLLYADKLISSRFQNGRVNFTPADFVGRELIVNDNALAIIVNDGNNQEVLRTNHMDTWDFLLTVKLYEQWKHNGENPATDDEEIVTLVQNKRSSREGHIKRLSASQLLTEEQRGQIEKFSQALKRKERGFSKEEKAVVELAEIFAKIYVAYEASLQAEDKASSSETQERRAEMVIEQFRQHRQVMSILEQHKDIYMMLDSVAALNRLHRNSAQEGEKYTSFPRDPANETEFFVRQGLNTVLLNLLNQALPKDTSDKSQRTAKLQGGSFMPTNAHPVTEAKESSLSSPVDSDRPPRPSGNPPSRETSKSVNSGLPPRPSGNPPSREASRSVDSQAPKPELPSAEKPEPYKSRRADKSKKSSAPAPKQEQKEEIIIVKPPSKKRWSSASNDAESQPLLASEQEREETEFVSLLQDEKNPGAQNSAALLDGKLKSLRRSLTPLPNEQKPDTSWVSAALLDSQLVPFVEDMRQIPDSWSLQLRNGFIEAVSPEKLADKSFAGTNQQCMIALTGLKLPSETIEDVQEKLENDKSQKGGQAQSQSYNSACTADLVTRLTSIADATESLIKSKTAQGELQKLRQLYLNKIQQLNLEELFEQLDREKTAGKAKRLSLKDWVTKSLFTGAKGWSAFYKEYQRQHPVLKQKEIAKGIKQAGDIMADYLREAQKIAVQHDGKPFKIKDVAKQESRQIGDKGRSAFIGLFDFADNIFADCQIPIGKSTVPSTNRGLTHEGYANFVKTGFYRYENGHAELLFQGYRHSAAPPIDIKDEKTKIAKTKQNIETGLAQQFADILQPRFNSEELDPQKYDSEESALPMSVASLSLLTPEHGFLKPFHDKGSNNAQLAMIDKTFAELDGKALPVKLESGQTIYVRPDICLMNAPTNHAGAIHYYTPEDFNGINQRGFAKLIGRIQKHLDSEAFDSKNVEVDSIKKEFQALLAAEPAKRQQCIDDVKTAINTFWADADNKTDSAKEQCNFLQLAVEIIEIYSRGLRENALNMLEFQACFMMLNYMMGGIVEMYCKSGKDRTGAVDEMIKAKYLSQYAEGAKGRFSSYIPLNKRVEHGLDSTFKFIKGPLATMQRCGASPFAAGENAYGARNLQRNKFLAGFASGGQTPIDLALAKLNKKPFSLANAKVGKKVVMALGGVLLLAPALIYWAGQFINHHLIQRFSRADYDKVSLKALADAQEKNAEAKAKVVAAEEAAKAKTQTVEQLANAQAEAQTAEEAAKKNLAKALATDAAATVQAKEKDNSYFQSSLAIATMAAASVDKQERPDNASGKQPPISEAQATVRDTMTHVEEQLKGTESSSNDKPGNVRLVLGGGVSPEVVEARAFVDALDNRKNESTDKYRQYLTDACNGINEYFTSLPSNSQKGENARVISNNGYVFIGELFKENVTKKEVKNLKPPKSESKSTVDNNSNAYVKSQEALTSLVVLSLPNSGIVQNKQGAYVIQQSDGKFVQPTLELVVGKNFHDMVTLRNVLAILLKVRELLEKHNKAIDPSMSVELKVTVQRDNSEETIYFSKEDGLQRIKALTPNTWGSLMAKADAREKSIRAAFDKFDLALNTPNNEHVATHKIA